MRSQSVEHHVGKQLSQTVKAHDWHDYQSGEHPFNRNVLNDKPPVNSTGWPIEGARCEESFHYGYEVAKAGCDFATVHYCSTCDDVDTHSFWGGYLSAKGTTIFSR